MPYIEYNNRDIDSDSDYDDAINNRSSDTESDDNSIILENITTRSSTTIFYNSDDDLTLESTYNEIYILDNEFIERNKIDGEYIIGTTFFCENRKQYIYSSGVTANIFFEYSFDTILQYTTLTSYYISRYSYTNTIDIIKIYIDNNDSYIAITKTYWLRLIQRHWKKVISEQKRIKNERKSILSIRTFELFGKWNYGNRNYPRLRGMLSIYGR
jgi:hypothetical protein